VPDVVTGSGWSAESAQVSQATDDGTLTLSNNGANGIVIEQTFPAQVRMTAFEYTIDTPPSLAVQFATLSVYAGTSILGAVGVIPTTAGTHKVTLSVPAEGATSVQLAFGRSDNQAFNIGFAHGNARYADGALTTPTGSGEAAGDDLVFVVYGQTQLGFNTSNPVLVSCSESSKTVAIDYVQRIPADYAAIAYRPAASGSLGLFYDADTDTPYIADADGIGPAQYDRTDVIKPLRVKPGVVNRVVLGILQEDAAVAGFTTLAYKVRKRYLTATG
jgi:hypothetical protein